MLKTIPPSNISVNPLRVHKEYRFTENTITPYFAKQITGSLFDPLTDERTNGVYKRVLYDSIKSQFYTNPATSSILTEVGFRNSYASTDERTIGSEIGVISIPQSNFGEGIKRGSVNLIDGSNTYVDDTNSNLRSGSVSGSIAGNVFYDRGLIILTNSVVSGSTLSQFTLNYRATTTIYETEILLNVEEGEFNVSQNPSAVDNGFIKLYNFTSSFDSTTTGGFGDYEYSSSVDPTGSYLTPYITTIGLYDDTGAMVAVAKLPTPIKSLPDYPINFLVRLDT
jgi:hypothetical protein